MSGTNTARSRGGNHNPRGNPQYLAPPWKPGQSGNPSGRPKSKLGGVLARRAEAKAGELADKLLALALSGDMQAMKYLYDRVLGTPTQRFSEDSDEVRRELERIARDYGRPLEDVERDAEKAGLRVVK